MIQLTALNGKKAGATWQARRLPIRLGRAPTSAVCLEEDGVWEAHAEISRSKTDGFQFTVLGEALAAVNGQPVRQTRIRPGDIIELGAAKLLFAFSPTRPRSQRLREALTWLALAGLCVGQAALIYWLMG